MTQDKPWKSRFGTHPHTQLWSRRAQPMLSATLPGILQLRNSFSTALISSRETALVIAFDEAVGGEGDRPVERHA